MLFLRGLHAAALFPIHTLVFTQAFKHTTPLSQVFCKAHSHHQRFCDSNTRFDINYIPEFRIRSPMLTPKDIASADTITGIRLSEDASSVLYSVGPISRPGDHWTSSLWIAKTASAGSATQVTFGDYKDQSAVFHPDGKHVYFLSDRPKAGGDDHIYRISISSSTEDAVPITSPEITAGISSFALSPDGKYIAFISTDKSSSEEENAEKPDIARPEIWGEKKSLGRLRLLDLDNIHGGVRTLVSVDANVDSFTWSSDSSKISYRLTILPDVESYFLPVDEEIVSISTDANDSINVIKHPRMPGSRTVWTEKGDLFFIKSITPESPVSSNALWKCPASEGSSASLVGYGETDDLNTILDVKFESKVAVEVATGLETKIDIIDANGQRFTAFETQDDVIAFMEWDIKRVEDGRYVFVALRSSGATGEPENIWSGSTEDGKTGFLSKKLSSHHEWFDRKAAPISKKFYWKGSDGHPLEGIISYPAGKEPVKLPTVVVPHGGPYGRDVLDVFFSYDRWRPFLASQGYLVLCPNYRGSRGHGDKFAKAADGGMGTWDWDDIESMIDAAIVQNIADPNKLGIAGDSQGGFLAAWGCTRPNNRFKAGVISAGPTDWGSLSMTSDMPDMEARLGGNAPWSSSDPKYLAGSPIRYVKNVNIPLLMIHGKDDRRVPVTQAIGFMRGLMREGKVGNKSQLVIYPREGHAFEERLHAEDVCRRLVEYLDAHLR